jgi:hypothetical protein
MTNRNALYILMILAPLGWGGLLLFTRFVPPHTTLAFAAFFVLLGVAITSTFSPVLYFMSLRFLSSRGYRATVRHSIRQGALIALCVIFNLILLALHGWNVFTAILILGIAIVVEVLALGRK